MPFTAMRPSLLAPPLAEKNVIVGDSAMPLPSTVRPGVALSSAPAARDAGIVWIKLLSMTTSRRALCTSTTGVSPVTVIVSSTPPTLHVGRNGEDLRTGQLDAVTLDGDEAGQRERQGVGARPQIDDAVLARAIGDRGPDLLDQGRARCFNGDAGQHGAGRVSNGSREGRLGKYGCREEQHNEERQTLEHGSHTGVFSLQ